jgi:seryl-tRNA synthetase
MKKILLHRVHACARFIFFGCALLLLSGNLALAQTTSLPPPQRPDNPGTEKDDRPLTTFEEELRAKRAIKLAEKEHQENVKRACDLAQLAKELQSGLKGKTAIDRESEKKLDRLEKLTKKIRGEAGGEDEEVKIIDRPSDITSAVNQIAESADSLSKNVQNTPRQVVSASVIGNANVLLELIKLLRAFDPRP